MMSQDDARLRLEKNIRNYRWMQENKMYADSSGLDDRIDACLIAVDAIDKLQKIQKIVADFNATRDSSPMVERAYAESTKNEKVECFDQIQSIIGEVS